MSTISDAAAPAREGLRPRDVLLLLAVAVAMLAPGLSSLPPVDRDESRYAQATSQMLETRNFIDVRFQDQPRYLQPVGIYWLQSAAVTATGALKHRDIWAYRLPSTICAVLAVLVTAWIGAMAFGRTAGIVAGLLMAFSVLLGFEARMAKIDATLLLATLLAQAALARIYLARGSPTRPRLTAALFWAALGAGLLLKGPIILIVSGGTILGVWLTERRWRWMKGLHAGWGVLLMLAIAAPWFVAIGVETHGAFFDKAVKHNLLGKVGRGEQAHGQPPGYYLALFTLTFWPGSLAVAAALPFAWRERTTSAVRFLLAWIIPTWLLYELIATKLPHYALPFYPALACLAAGAATAAMRTRSRPAAGWRIAGGVYTALWLGGGLALAAAAPVISARMGGPATALSVALAAGAGVLACATAALFWRRRGGFALACAGAAAFLMALNTYVVILPSLTPIWLSPRIVAAAQRLKPCPALDLSSSSFSPPSLVFLSGGVVRLISVEKAADELAADRACRLALVDRKALGAFITRTAAAGVPVRSVGEVQGLDYSTGHKLDLLFLQAAPAAPPPAASPR